MIILDIPRRLALVLWVQIATCVYVVLGVGALMKIRMSGNQDIYLPISGLSLWVKSHGWMLMALPVAWYWLHVRRWLGAGADWAYLTRVVVSGVAVVLMLLVLALFATEGMFMTKDIVYGGFKTP